jgi:F0F1-type ATP synthase membrane subunit b/b'
MSLNPLAQINLITLGSVMLLFVVTLIMLRRVCFVPIITVMECRAAKIAAARLLRDEAQKVLDAARRDAEVQLAAAKAEADRITAECREGIAQRRAAAIAQAGAEAQTILAAGKEAIRALRRTEGARLQTELHSSVAATLTKMLVSVDDAALRLMVQRALDVSAGR